ncbi:sterile alpha motif domain-containing protein 15 isoform X2 [Apodemus sylvaticus]|uniref:sterile alpha motif domain-containing protein 15 isoform X2 n=1 Tax=Apodemus sylvaticus TaxID=10129 RepID=UPI002243BA73|nr:sterile alpha motif domain-containing protein 15 isoform X2 [Apodemus sylvaticus]
MSKVPEDYDSDPDENLSLQPKRTKSGKLHNAKADAMFELSSELSPNTDQDPGNVGNVLLEPTRTGNDLEVPVDKKEKVPDLQPPDVSVGVLKDPEQKTPDFRSEKPRKSVEEEDLSPSKMTKSEKKQSESVKGKSSEPYELTKPKTPDRKLRKSTEEAVLKPPEGLQVKSTEQPEQIKFSDKKLRQSTKKRVSGPLEDSGDESRRSIAEASLELSEKRTLKASKKAHKSSFDDNFPEMLEEITLGLLEEIKPDVEDETQEEPIKEKIPEPLGDRKPSAQRHRLRRSTGESKLKDTLTETSKEKEPVPQTQTEPEIPKEKVIKSTEKTGDKPPQITNLDIQEKTQPEPTNEKNLELSNEPKPGEKEKEFPKEDRPESSKPKYPIGKDELMFSDYHPKLSEKKPAKIKNEFIVGTPRESVESFSTVYEAHEFLKDLQADMNELFPIIPSSEALAEPSIALSQETDILGRKESKSSLSPQIEHLTWSPERVAEWISDLGFPQYKECFTENFISGRKLIHVNCSNLPQMGITDFEDMKDFYDTT